MHSPSARNSNWKFLFVLRLARHNSGSEKIKHIFKVFHRSRNVPRPATISYPFVGLFLSHVQIMMCFLPGVCSVNIIIAECRAIAHACRSLNRIKFHPVFRYVNAFKVHQSGTKTMRTFKKWKLHARAVECDKMAKETTCACLRLDSGSDPTLSNRFNRQY